MFSVSRARGGQTRFVGVCASHLLGLASLFLVAGCEEADVEPISADRTKYVPASSVTGTQESQTPGATPNRQPTSESPKSETRQPTQDSVAVRETPATPVGQNEPTNSTEKKSGNTAAPLPDRVDPDNLPNGTPEEMLAHIAELSERRPRGLTREQQLADFKNLLLARQRLAEKVLAGKATDEQRVAAAQAKLEALLTKLQAGVNGADQEVVSFCKVLSKDEAAPVKRLGRITMFQIEYGDLSQADEETIEKAVAELKTLLESEGAIAQLFQPAQGLVEALVRARQGKQAVAVSRMIGDLYSKSKDERLADAGRQTLKQAESLSMQLELGTLVNALQDGDPKAAKDLTAWVKKSLADGATAEMYQVLSQVLNIVEYLGQYQAAEELYDTVGKAYENFSDPRVATQAARSAESAKKRIGLVGKPLNVEGALLSGDAFDWSKYKGKIVLLDFWATWCGPCLQEIPNIRRSYEAHREEGFEVIGINLDEDLSQVEQFFAVQKLPWTTIISADANAGGFDNPMAKRCGVSSIPFVVLIGRDGKVLDIHVRGPKLEEKLVALLDAEAKAGKADSKADPKKASQLRPISRLERGFVGVQETAPAAKETSTVEPKTPAAGNAIQAKGKDAVAPQATESNPYAARENLSTSELIDFVFNMQEKPRSIQSRQGFTEALVEATDRILQSKDASDKFRQIATLAKIEALHKHACRGVEAADLQLNQFITTLTNDTRPKVAAEVRFLELERRVIEADKLPLEKIPAMLEELKKFCTDVELTHRHLRLASASVQLMNRIEDEDEREKEFQAVGKLLAKSENRELARYGRKLAKPVEKSESDLVGKPIELKGTTAAGAAFDWKSYRGKVVLVDFWATWCGPCVREMPNVKALYEKYRGQGFEIVGVSLDKDLDALNDFLMQHEIAWSTLAGDDTQELATQYGVRGIPTMMLVDQEGKVVAVSHRSGDLIGKLEKLLVK